MNKKIVILGFTFLVILSFAAGRITSKKATTSVQVAKTLNYSDIPIDSTKINCETKLTVSVGGQNNPERQGLFGSIFNNEESTNFQIDIKDKQLTLNNFSIFQATDLWDISTNEDMLIAQLLLPSQSEPDAQNFFTIFLDKKTGQGVLNRNWMDQYVNRQVSNYSTYFSCSI